MGAHPRTLLVVCLVAWGCAPDESDEQVAPVAGECTPGERRIGQACVPAGVQASGCLAGELTRDDGSCQAAGVPAEACASGFEPDGDLGCIATLPSDACPAGELAIPGDGACRAVMACDAAKWGAIPVDGNTIYVDGSYTGGNNDGSSARPYLSVQEGVDAAASGAIVAIAAGAYDEALVLTGKAVRLWGACASQVNIDGAAALAAVLVREGADGTELHALGLSGENAALLVSGAEDVVAEQIWAHDTPRPISIEDTLGPTSLFLRDSLIEGASDAVAFNGGAQLTVERSLLRGPPPGAPGAMGSGLGAEHDTFVGMRAGVTIHQSVIERVTGAGVFVQGGDVAMDGSVVRDVEITPGDPITGYGIGATELQSETSSVTVRSSLFERIRTDGVIARSSSVDVRATVFRDIAGPSPEGASAVFVMAGPVGRGAGTVIETLAERIGGMGIGFYGADGIIEATAIRDMHPRADLQAGFGIGADDDRMLLERSTLSVRGSTVERSRMVAIFIDGSDAELEGVLVRDTMVNELDQLFGRGIQVQRDPHSFLEASAKFDGSLIENTFEFGIAVVSATVVVEGTALRGSAVGLSDSGFGDGIAVSANPELPGTLVIRDSLVMESQRAGVAVFGGNTELSGTHLDCNSIHLDGEHAYTFRDLGGNVCGCDADVVDCKILTSALTPPAAL